MFERTRYLGFGLTIVFLALVFWKVDLGELRSALGSANYLLLIPAVCCTLTGYLVRTLRWQQILAPTRRIPTRTLFPVLMIGFMANNVLPARMGEVVRAYALGRKVDLSKSLGLATILIERLCDGIGLLLVLGLIALRFPLPAWGREAGLGAAALFFGAAGVILALLHREQLSLALLRKLLRPLPAGFGAKAEDKVASFLVGLRSLRSGRRVLILVVLSLVVWSFEGASYYLILLGFHPTMVYGEMAYGDLLVAALFMMVVVNLGIMIPSAPGYVGTFQFFGVLALGTFGIPHATALGAAIVSHASQWILVTAIGLAAFLRETWSWSDVARSRASAGVPETGTVADVSV